MSKKRGEDTEELDDADRRLLELEKELEAEEKAREAARTPKVAATSEDDATTDEDPDDDEKADDPETDPPRRRRRPKRKSRPQDEPEFDEDDEEEDEEDASPGKGASDYLGEKKRALKKEASEAMAEIAVGSLSNPSGVTDVAVSAISRRLPSLPSRAQVRNVALGGAGVVLATWLMWGTIGWVFGWLWFAIKLGIVGGVGWAGYKLYGLLPESEKAATEEEDEED